MPVPFTTPSPLLHLSAYIFTLLSPCLLFRLLDHRPRPPHFSTGNALAFCVASSFLAPSFLILQPGMPWPFASPPRSSHRPSSFGNLECLGLLSRLLVHRTDHPDLATKNALAINIATTVIAQNIRTQLLGRPGPNEQPSLQ